MLTEIPSEKAIEHMVALVRERQAQGEAATRAALLMQQHDPRTVDMALARVYGYKIDASEFMPPRRSNDNDLAIASLVATTLGFANIVIIAALMAATYNVLSRSVPFEYRMIALVIPLLAVLGIEWAAIPQLRRRSPARARGVGWGIVATMGFVMIVIGSFILNALTA